MTWLIIGGSILISLSKFCRRCISYAYQCGARCLSVFPLLVVLYCTLYFVKTFVLPSWSINVFRLKLFIYSTSCIQTFEFAVYDIRMRLKPTSSQLNPFIPTFFLIMAKTSLPKRSLPYWSNPPFLISLTFGHFARMSKN